MAPILGMATTPISILELFSISEMARPVANATLAALEKVRQSRKDFDVNDFVGWMNDVGGKANKVNATGYLRRWVASNRN